MTTEHPTELATTLASMPILTADEIYQLPLARRQAIIEREQMLARLKTNANRAAAEHDIMMRRLNAQGARARRRAEETQRIIAEIKATPVVPDVDGEENFRRLDDAVRTRRRSA